MKRVLEVGRRLLREEDAATTTEYGLLVALIAVGLVVALTGLRTAIIGAFNKAAAELTNASK
jgi:pilus assembly protein Flp/PilA